MDNDKFGSTTGVPAQGSGNDKEPVDNLYSDLPKDVVDMLIETHPLMNRDGEVGERSRMRRRPQRDDLDEVREARMQQVGSEIQEISKAPMQEGEPTQYASKRVRTKRYSENTAHTSAPTQHKIEDEDYADGIQYVSVMPSKKKSKIVEEITLQTTSGAKPRKKVVKEDAGFEEFKNGSKTRYQELDFEEKAKQAHLDSLYDDFDDYDDHKGVGKLGIIIGVVGLLLIAFLIFRTVSLGSQLESAKNQLETYTDINTRYEAVQLEKMQLEEELSKLQGTSGTEGSEDTTGSTAGSATTGTTTTGTTTGSTTGSTSSSASQYTVAEGDTIWDIAQKLYGNGAEYQKILDANNMKESDSVSIGQVLIIP